MENPESQMKDSQLMRMLEQPVLSASFVNEERAIEAQDVYDDEEEEDDEMFIFTRSTLNLLIDSWNTGKSMLQNLKTIIGFLQSYVISQGKIDPSAVRVREGKIMKDALANLLGVWKKKRRRGCSAACSVEDLNIFLVEEKLAATLSEDIMTESTFREWTEDFKEFVGRRPTLRVDAAAAARSSSAGGDGLTALFSGSSFGEEENDERLPQYISKVENGRMHTVRTPGEVGHSLIRLDVYEVRDIVKRDKRDWWKYAKLRTQILTSSPKDSKLQQLVRQMLDLAADDLIGLPGLRKEVNSLAQ